MRKYIEQSLEKHHKKVKIAIIIIFSALILIDVYLVFDSDFPTFSRVFLINRTGLIWMTFLYGTLIAKIFFNQPTYEKKKEIRGLIGVLIIAIFLFILGWNTKTEVRTEWQVFLMLIGGIYANLFWPQYKLKQV